MKEILIHFHSQMLDQNSKTWYAYVDHINPT